MSDIRKAIMARLGEFARPGTKAKMQKEYVLWGLPKGKTDAIHEQVLSTKAKTPAEMDAIKRRAAADGWHSFRVQILDLSKPYKGFGFSRPGAKAAFGKPQFRVRKLHNGYLAVDVNQGSGWERYDTTHEDEWDGLDDYERGYQKAYARGLRWSGGAWRIPSSQSSRPGAKAAMAKWTVVMPSIPDAGTRHFDSWEQAKNYVDTKMGGFTALVSVDGKRYALKHALGQWEKFSRPGAKAEMGKFNSGDSVVVPYGREMVRGKIVRYDEPSMAYVVDIGRYESIKVAKEDVRKAAMSRPGAKAAFAGDWHGKRVTSNAGKIFLVQRSATGYDLYSVDSGKKAKSMTQEQMDEAQRAGKFRDVFSGHGAKTSMGYSTIRKVTTTDVAGGGTWRKTMEKYGTKKAAVMTYTNNGQVGQVYQDPDNPSVFKAFDMDGRELGSGSEADMKRKVESLAFAKTGSKSTHASLWNRFTVVLRSKRTGNRFLWNTEAKNEADAKDNAYALYGDAYEVIEVAMRPSLPGVKATNALTDACWQGYEAVGTKKQDGKTVPNCVPKATAAKPDSQDIESEEVKAGLKLMEKADEKVSDKIRTLIKEGKPQDQAVAIALDMKRRGEL